MYPRRGLSATAPVMVSFSRPRPYDRAIMDAFALTLAPQADARARAFAAARRHSRLVRALRRTLEIGIFLGIVAVVVMAALRNFGGVLRGVGFEGVGIEGGRITMDKPRLSGSRPNGG